MCELCQMAHDSKHSVGRAACELIEINTNIDIALLQLLAIAADIRQAEKVELQIEAALQVIDALHAEALRARNTVDNVSQALRLGSRFVELDALTGLPNRLLLLDRLNQCIAAAKRANKKFAVLFIDLDGFKSINDTHGHAVGDHVLQHVATCLKSAVRQVDTVSRFGGDEFIVLLTDVCDNASTAVAAEKILATLRDRCELGGNRFEIAASVGMSIYPADGTTAEALIARADEAMYRAKRSGVGSVSI